MARKNKLMDVSCDKEIIPDELVVDFGNEFGTLVKSDISNLFIQIHATVSPLDPLNKMDAELEKAT